MSEPVQILVVFDDDHCDRDRVTFTIQGLAPHGISVRTLRLSRFRISQWFQNKLLRRSLPRHNVKLLYVLGAEAPNYLSQEFKLPLLFSPLCLNAQTLGSLFSTVSEKFRDVKKKVLLYPFQKDLAVSIGSDVDNDVLNEPVSIPTVSAEARDKFRWGMGLVPGRLIVAVIPNPDDLTAWQTFIEGCELWLSSHGSFQLLVYASFADRKLFRRALTHRSLNEYCFWAEPSVRLDSFLAAADVAVFPSNNLQSFREILQAMSVGRPVIAIENEISQVLVQNGRSGLLLKSPLAADWAEALGYLEKEPARREGMGDNGAQIIKREHDPARHFSELADSIRSLTN